MHRQFAGTRANAAAARLKVAATGGLDILSETIWARSSLSYRVAKDRWKMSFEYWYAISSEGRIIRYGYKELSDGVAAISVTVDGRSVMILQRSLRAPLTRAQVETLFEEKSAIKNLTGEEYRSSAASGC
jgi:hypothetical protein